MADPNKSTVVMTQVVDKQTKIDLDRVTHDLGNFALKNNLRQPNKGEVLSKMVKIASKNFDIEGYFKNQA